MLHAHTGYWPLDFLIVMHLSLIGMSGSGKSHWSEKLAELGFRRFCCDDLIADKLAAELGRSDGTAMNLGEWMGFPYETRYRERESKYLSCEIAVLGEILDYLSVINSEEKVVVDTTGSVIYAGENILKRLSSTTTVVHLPTPPEVKERMLQVYVNQARRNEPTSFGSLLPPAISFPREIVWTARPCRSRLLCAQTTWFWGQGLP